ncbi:hypothetical protein ACNKHK_21560 [Shigella flexneri]
MVLTVPHTAVDALACAVAGAAFDIINTPEVLEGIQANGGVCSPFAEN